MSKPPQDPSRFFLCKQCHAFGNSKSQCACTDKRAKHTWKKSEAEAALGKPLPEPLKMELIELKQLIDFSILVGSFSADYSVQFIDAVREDPHHRYNTSNVEGKNRLEKAKKEMRLASAQAESRARPPDMISKRARGTPFDVDPDGVQELDATGLDPGFIMSEEDNMDDWADTLSVDYQGAPKRSEDQPVIPEVRRLIADAREHSNQAHAMLSRSETALKADHCSDCKPRQRRRGTA